MALSESVASRLPKAMSLDESPKEFLERVRPSDAILKDAYCLDDAVRHLVVVDALASKLKRKLGKAPQAKKDLEEIKGRIGELSKLLGLVSVVFTFVLGPIHAQAYIQVTPKAQVMVA